MDIDLKDGTITFRIVYAGPRGATKFLNLRGLQGGHQDQALSVLHAGTDRVVTFEVPADAHPPVLGLKARYEAVAAPGEVTSSALERLLLLAADAVVFLPERGKPAGRDSKKALARLVHDLEFIGRDPKDVPLIVQDYVDGQPRLEPRALDASVMALDPVFLPVKGDTPETTRSVFDAAREALLERVNGLVQDLGEAGARDALLQRVHDRERALDEARSGASGDPWWRAAVALLIGAAAAGAFLAWVI